jgi:hypothetical protein
LVVAVSICVIGISACGSSSKTSSSPGSLTSSTSAKQNIAADTAAAQAASLKLSDFPPGWTSDPQSSDTGTGTDAIDNDLARCLGVEAADLASGPVDVNSDDFSDPNGQNISSSEVDYQPTAKAQNAEFDLWSNPKTPECLAKSITTLIKDEIQHPTDSASTLPPGLTLGQATVQPMSFPTFGGKTVPYRITLSASVNDQSIDMYFDLVAAIKGRAVALVIFFGGDNPFPIDQEQHYTGLVVGRLTNT